MELGEREKGKEKDRVTEISHTIIYEGRGYKDVYRKLLKNGECEVKV
jgi:hypothetical protein